MRCCLAIAVRRLFSGGLMGAWWGLDGGLVGAWWGLVGLGGSAQNVSRRSVKNHNYACNFGRRLI